MEATVKDRADDFIFMEEELLARREQADAVLPRTGNADDDADPDPECLPCLIADLDD